MYDIGPLIWDNNSICFTHRRASQVQVSGGKIDCVCSQTVVTLLALQGASW